jgi:hypothetical protein
MADRRFEDVFGDSWKGLGRAFGGEQRTGEGSGPDFSALFAPVDPYNRWPSLVPFISVLGAAAVVLLTGVAAASLVVMSFALLLVLFLLSEVFGYEIAVPTMTMR